MIQILVRSPELGEAKDIVVAADAPIIAALCSDNTIKIFRLNQSSVSPIRTIDAGRLIVGLALDPTGQRLYAAAERLGLDVLSWRVDAESRTLPEMGSAEEKAGAEAVKPAEQKPASEGATPPQRRIITPRRGMGKTGG